MARLFSLNGIRTVYNWLYEWSGQVVQLLRGLAILAALLLLSSCGRYFHGPLQPTADQSEGMAVNDDGSVTYRFDRLAINLKPMTDAELNRTVSGGANPAVNPYTFGDWSAPGDDWTPPRFTVFRLAVDNYQYPKVKLDPLKTHITTPNSRLYGPLSYAQLYDYFRSYWQGRIGLGRVEFQARTGALRQTLYSGAVVFSGRDEQGYLVFPLLHDDVGDIQVHIEDIVVRFDFADQPVETIDLTFSFQREVRQGFTPTSAVRRN